MNRFIIVTIFSCLALLSGCSAPNKDFKKAEILQADNEIKEKEFTIAVSTKMYAYLNGELVLITLTAGNKVKIMIKKESEVGNAYKETKPKKKQILL
jgi:hypothetical protein